MLSQSDQSASQQFENKASGLPFDEAPAPPQRPEIRPAFEPTCCGSGCIDCPF